MKFQFSPRVANCLRILINTYLALFLCACDSQLPGCAGEELALGNTRVTSPAFGANVTTLPPIQGVYAFTPLSTVGVVLTRDRDGKSWDGTSWGGSGPTNLPLVDTGGGTWQTNVPMPSGTSLNTGLVDGYYLIRLTVPGPTGGTNYTPFAVGNQPPPVVTTPFAWGYNGSGAVGAGPGGNVNAATKVLTTGGLAGKVITRMATGAEHSLALTSDGRIFNWGLNDRGQLGRGNNGGGGGPVTTPSDVPVEVLYDDNILPFLQVAGGDYHSLAVTRTGQILAWGDNTAGQLGTGVTNTTPQSSPTLRTSNFLPGGRLTAAVTGGSNFSVALAQDGTLYAWGANASGQLGDGTNTPRLTPVAVTGLSGKVIVQVDAGQSHVVALTATGEVYAWGLGASGLLGNGSDADSNVPVRVGQTGAMAGKIIAAISASRYHSLAVSNDGRVYTWGSNVLFGLGDGGVLTSSNVPLEVGGALTGRRATRIAAGWVSSLVVTSDAKMFAWGNNNSGNLCGAGAFGANVTVPTEAVIDNAITPFNIPAVLATGWDHAVLLTAPGPGPVPDLVVEARGATLLKGSELLVGTNALGTSNVVTVTMRNLGPTDLDGIAISRTGSAFALIAPPTTRLGPGQSLTFDVAYTASTVGVSIGTLQILSNDPTDGVFTLNLTGVARALGAVDTTFPNPVVAGSVNAIAVQTDRKVVIGGSIASVGGIARNNLARLNANGTLDAGFNPNVNGPVNAIALQPDGKIVIGGNFTQVGVTARGRIARLNADGTLDATFTASASDGQINALHVYPDGTVLAGGSFTLFNGGGPSFLQKLTPTGNTFSAVAFDPQLSSQVRCLAVQDDGFIVIGGNFNTVRGQSRIRMARLEPDGFPDPDFIADTTGGNVFTVLVQTDGRILAGGDFTTINGVTRNNIARLSATGAVDTGFTTQINSAATAVTGLARQANGKTIVTGTFTILNGTPVGRIARINDTGNLDGLFSSGADGPVNGAVIQEDGTVYIGGNFVALGGTTRTSFARLTLENVTDTVDTLTFPGLVNWIHAESYPETTQATLEASINGGGTWTPFGNGARLTAPQIGWTWFNPALPANALLRLRATSRGGLNNGSGTTIEKILPNLTTPQLQVSVSGQPLTTGDTYEVGAARVGSAKTATFTVSNLGSGTLTGVRNTTVTGSSDFQIFLPPDDTLAGGATTTITVVFTPGVVGDQTASFAFHTNGSVASVSFTLRGTGGLPIEQWRQANFGNPNDVGLGANFADPDGDGRQNLLEYATGTLPNKADKDAAFFQSSNGVIYFFYQRSKAALADVSFQVEYTNSLTGAWQSDGVGQGVVISDDGTIQMVQTIIPQDPSPHRFARLRVTPLTQ